MALPANITNLVAAIENTARSVDGVGGGKQYLKLTKQGFWAFGADETEVEDGSRWAINPNSLAMGYACWDDGTNLGEEMALITDEPILKSNLPNLGAPWKEQIGFQLACISGDDKGVQCVYTATSVGGRNAFKTLLNEIAIKARSGSEEIVPVVELGVDSYKHKQYGRIFTPLLSVVEWASLDGAVADKAEAQIEQDEDAEEAPTTRRRRRA